mgnify:CR=1 FL=1
MCSNLLHQKVAHNLHRYLVLHNLQLGFNRQSKNRGLQSDMMFEREVKCVCSLAVGGWRSTSGIVVPHPNSKRANKATQQCLCYTVTVTIWVHIQSMKT